MRQDIYTLPEIVFVSGQSNTLRWRLFTMANVPYNADGCTGNFAVVDYSDQTGEPLISKPLSFTIGDDDTSAKNVAYVDLEPNDTLGLYGKYIYQITIKDVDGEVEIPNQGFLQITHNINESFLK
jgi:hypothetical protein